MIPTSIKLTSALETPSRDPKKIKVYGSNEKTKPIWNENNKWASITTINPGFTLTRGETLEYPISGALEHYIHYKFAVEDVKGPAEHVQGKYVFIFQIAEVQLWQECVKAAQDLVTCWYDEHGVATGGSKKVKTCKDDTIVVDHDVKATCNNFACTGNSDTCSPKCSNCGGTKSKYCPSISPTTTKTFTTDNN